MDDALTLVVSPPPASSAAVATAHAAALNAHPRTRARLAAAVFFGNLHGDFSALLMWIMHAGLIPMREDPHGLTWIGEGRYVFPETRLLDGGNVPLAIMATLLSPTTAARLGVEGVVVTGGLSLSVCPFGSVPNRRGAALVRAPIDVFSTQLGWLLWDADYQFTHNDGYEMVLDGACPEEVDAVWAALGRYCRLYTADAMLGTMRARGVAGDVYDRVAANFNAVLTDECGDAEEDWVDAWWPRVVGGTATRDLVDEWQRRAYEVVAATEAEEDPLPLGFEEMAWAPACIEVLE